MLQPGTESPPAMRLRIVGRSVFPFFGMGSFDPTGFGTGAQVSEPMPAANGRRSPSCSSGSRRARHASRKSRVSSTRFERGHICGVYNQCSMTTASRPTDILNYSRIQGTPVALAAVLALLAIGVVTNLLVTSIRRRRHDLAILKTLGIGRRGISATVAWQATTLVGVALLVGLPIGIAIGREIWSVFANGLGIPPRSARRRCRGPAHDPGRVGDRQRDRGHSRRFRRADRTARVLRGASEAERSRYSFLRTCNTPCSSRRK